MVYQFKNFATSKLTAPLSAVATSVSIGVADSLLFPIPLDPGVIFAVVLEDGVQPPEIIYCTNNPLTGNFTITRGEEGTVATSWPAGTLFLHQMTAQSLGFVAAGGNIEWVDILQGMIDDNYARLHEEITVVSDANESLSSLVTTLTTNFNNANASLSTTILALSDLSSATASFETEATAHLGDLDASVTTISSAVVSEGIARADADTALSVSVGTVTAGLATELSVRASADTALASSITTLTATVSTLTATVATETSARIAGDTAISSTVTTLTATVGTNTAGLAAELIARANGDSALSSSLTTLTATVSGVSATVTTQGTAIANLNGALYATYGLQVNANGAIASMVLYASSGDTVTSGVVFDVSSFVIKSGSHTNVSPFTYNATTGLLSVNQIEVDGAKIIDATITNAEIANATIQTANIANAAITTALIGSAQVTTAKIATANITTALIADANITTAKIADANITTAKIADANITSAKIGTASVQTLHIDNAAVINPIVAFTAGATSLGTTSYTTVQTCAIVATGQIIQILASFVPAPGAIGTTVVMHGKIFRGATLVYECDMCGADSGGYLTVTSAMLACTDSPAAGSYTYTFQIRIGQLGGGAWPGGSFSWTGNNSFFLQVAEFKR